MEHTFNYIIATKYLKKGDGNLSDIGIYIHIPFCMKKCHYCDFVSYDNCHDKHEEYIDMLCKEILQYSEILSSHNISTIYFGGGTPSYIDSKYITKVLEVLKLFSSNIDNMEVTIEVNPSSANFDKLVDYKNSGVNRVSIGLQSTHDKVLKNIGRSHTYNDFKKTLEDCNKIGINNISVDLMYPLPGLNLNMFTDSLNSIIKLKDKYNIKHISVYNLEVHENTRLKFLLDEGYLTLCDEDTEYEMRNKLNSILEKNNFHKYEISNYAINGYESKHNINYWNQGMYLGFGVNASSFFNGTRYTNISDIDKYIYNIKNNISVISEKSELDKLSLMKEYVILRLRLMDGIKVVDFNKKFNANIFDIFNTELTSLKNDNLIIIDKERNNIYLSNRGEEVANIVWEKFV